MTRRDELEAWDKRHVWHPFTPMRQYADGRPLIIDRADGCHLIDADGKRYLDGTAALWCNVHGHRVPEIDGAVRDQLGRVAHSTLLGMSNTPAVRFAKELADVAPDGLSHVFFSDNGATAVEVALKMGFQYFRQRPNPDPRKKRFLALQKAYHGDTLGDVSVGDIEHFHELFKPLLFETLRAPSPYCYRCPLGLERPSCDVACAGELERLVAEHADELVAVVVEPLVQGAAGMITAPAGHLRRVRDITKRHDVLMIADEVAVGFGRAGSMFACSQEGVVPDILCLAKGITGGYLPLAATLTHDEIYNAFLGEAGEARTFFHGHTYTGNPLGCAAASANLKLMPRVMADLPAKVERLAAGLRPLAELPIVGEVRQRGMMAGVELVRDRATREPFDPKLRAAGRACDLALEDGVLIRPLDDTIVIMPPLAISHDEIDLLTRAAFTATRRAAAELPP